MSAAKHTPGPWRAVIRANQRGISSVAVSTDDQQGREWWPVAVALYTEQNAADARLISAAPELLAAAIEARSAIRNQIEREQMHSPWLSQVFDLLDKSIAKATGEQA